MDNPINCWGAFGLWSLVSVELDSFSGLDKLSRPLFLFTDDLFALKAQYLLTIPSLIVGVPLMFLCYVPSWLTFVRLQIN